MTGTSSSLAFLACVEAGPLESQITLLARSIRTWGGRFSNAPIYAFKPRPGPDLAPATHAAFDELAVTFSDDVLNTDFTHYPISNKVFVGAAAETRCPEDVLVFLDSDTVVTSEPAELALPPGVPAAVRPVDFKRQASTGPGDRREAYWQKLYELCGCPEPVFAETTVDRVRIRGYWNAGLIATRRDSGLLGHWERDFRTLMAAEHVQSRIKTMDQMALAAAMARAGDRLRVLSATYNYPLPKRPYLAEPHRTAPLDDLVHVHYHRWFNKPGILDELRFDPDTPVARWLAPFLPLQPTHDDALPVHEISGAAT